LLEVPKASHQIELSLSGDQANSLKNNSKVQVQNFTSPNFVFLFCNVNPKVSANCANPHFVQAVRYGIDYPGLAAVAGNGAVQAAGVVPDAFLGALPQAQAVQFNPTRAKSELQASGLSNPNVKLEYVTSSTGLDEALAAKIKADLAAVGITVTLSGQPSAIGDPIQRTGKAQLGLQTWGPDYPDPNDYLAFLPGQLIGLEAGWLAGANPSLESLAAKAATTADNATRGQLWQQLQNQLNQEGPIYPLIHPGQAVVATSDLTNVTYNPQWSLDLAAIGSK
jgi:peptide/nickel transport system substrate-binding protein